MGKTVRIPPPTLDRQLGYCSVCPAGHGAAGSVDIIAVEHPDAESKRDAGGKLVRQWFGFCLRCARLLGKAATRGR